MSAARINHKNDVNLITLYQFPSHLGLPNASPFCMKVETYLRMVELPYQINFIMNPRTAPKGKLPYIKVNGEVIADSEFILDYLKAKFGNFLDDKLNEEQKALIVLLEEVFAERLYWLMLYIRWQDDEMWPHLRKAFFSKLTFFSRLFVPSLVRKQTLKALYMQGTGRHTQEEVLQMVYKTIDAIAVVLADKKYFLGEEPTSIDATAFGFLANLAWFPYDNPLTRYLQKQSNLLIYCDKMWSIFYPELTKPFAIV